MPHLIVVRAVRQFHRQAATDESLADRVRRFCEDLERAGRQDGQVQQAEQALRIYFVNFLNRTDWHRQPASPVVDTDGRVDPLTALQLLRARIRTRHYSYRTEASYADWVRRFLDYLAQQHGPRPQVTAAGIRDFLAHLAVHRHVSASTQNQAQCALLFLAREVLALEVDSLSQATRAKRGDRLPVVLSVPDTAALLEALRGTSRLMASLIYGGGLRVSECCQLRFKDLDFDSGLIFVRSGKGDKDRSTSLPDALERKYPNAGRELAMVWVFPSRTLSTDPRAGIVRRHHLHESVIQKAVKEAATIARIHKPVSVHTLRHSFATPLLLNGVDIRQIQEYLGHANVETTMVYTHVVRDLRTPARSPLDALPASPATRLTR